MEGEMDDRHPEFLRLYTAAQQPIFAFLRSMGHDLNSAEDALQDVAVALWESYPSYDHSRSFVGWAFGIARNVALKRLRYDRVRSKTVVNTEICEKIATHVAVELESAASDLADERARMEECLEKLPEHSQSVVRMRYEKRMGLREISTKMGKSYHAVGMMLTRIKSRLLDCVSADTGGVRA